MDVFFILQNFSQIINRKIMSKKRGNSKYKPLNINHASIQFNVIFHFMVYLIYALFVLVLF